MKFSLQDKVFRIVGEAADALGIEAYVVGGYVRDLMLGRESKDVDFVAVGSGIDLAQEVARRLGRRTRVHVYRTYGTAQVKSASLELEFGGARRESYRRDSRNPIVEDGTLEDDLKRRDFTINAMAISVNSNSFGELVDMFDGQSDLQSRLIRTPLDPDITFSDDPLRMLRAIRFATQLDFSLFPETFEAIRRNAGRIAIITRERIVTELNKIMGSAKPSIGWRLLSDTGLLDLILPELAALKGVEVVKGLGHKDNFDHTMKVLDNVASKSDKLWLRWGALLHDIAKPVTKRFEEGVGWTFHNHNYIGARMVERIFKKLKLPLDERMRYVAKIVELHMRPIALVEEEVTDSAIRRLIYEAGDDIDDLMTLCKADITSKNQERVRRHLVNFELVQQKMVDLNERDRIRNFQPPIDGNEIMDTFGLRDLPSSELHIIGDIKKSIKDAILDGLIPNEHDAAREWMLARGAEMGLTPRQ